MAYNKQTGHTQEHHHPSVAVPITGTEPVENIWQYLRGAFLSNRVFEDYAAILDAGCQAWKNLVANPTIIHSIGMRKWAHIGQT